MKIARWVLNGTKGDTLKLGTGLEGSKRIQPENLMSLMSPSNVVPEETLNEEVIAHIGKSERQQCMVMGWEGLLRKVAQPTNLKDGGCLRHRDGLLLVLYAARFFSLYHATQLTSTKVVQE